MFLSGNQLALGRLVRLKDELHGFRNMYTAPAYRRQGIAFHTLDLLVKDAREQGVSQIALEATEMGRPLYENMDL